MQVRKAPSKTEYFVDFVQKYFIYLTASSLFYEEEKKVAIFYKEMIKSDKPETSITAKKRVVYFEKKRQDRTIFFSISHFYVLRFSTFGFGK